jgi:hypothetical protein
MLKYTILPVILLMALLSGCGGGSDSVLPPTERDLSGLEGTWIVNLSYSGTLSGLYGDENISDSGVGTWVISKNAIDSGFPLEWSYNGTTLNIHWQTSVQSNDPVCGTVDTTVSAELAIAITPTGTSAGITGSGTVTKVREKCNDSTGTISYTGTISR